LGDEDVWARVVGCWLALGGVGGEVAVAGNGAAGELVGEHHRGVEDIGGVVAGEEAEREFGVPERRRKMNMFLFVRLRSEQNRNGEKALGVWVDMSLTSPWALTLI